MHSGIFLSFVFLRDVGHVGFCTLHQITDQSESRHKRGRVVHLQLVRSSCLGLVWRFWEKLRIFDGCCLSSLENVLFFLQYFLKITPKKKKEKNLFICENTKIYNITDCKEIEVLTFQ